MRANDLWMSFRGVRSDEVGARVMRVSAPCVGQERGWSATAAGRDGCLWIADGGRGTLLITATLCLPASARDAVAAWLGGLGQLITSRDPETAHRARVSEGVRFEANAYGPGTLSATVTFVCQPWRQLAVEPVFSYASADAEPVEIDGAACRRARLPGAGNIYARPEITIEVSGDDASITLMVNGWTLMFEHINESVTIDCDAMLCLTNGVNVSRRMTIITDEDDEWPRLYGQGETNLISWLASDPVTSVTVKPRWRWL